jgi:flagellar biosynthetic protein FliQ
MELDRCVDMVREALYLMLLLSAPILLAGLLVGLLVSLIQAVTQVQEQTLSFVPKMLAMAVATVMLAPWMARLMMEFAVRMFGTQ